VGYCGLGCWFGDSIIVITNHYSGKPLKYPFTIPTTHPFTFHPYISKNHPPHPSQSIHTHINQSINQFLGIHFSPIQRTLITGPLLRPLNNTVQVEVMLALPLNRHAVVSGHFAARARRLEGELADRAQFLLGGDVPHPRCDRVPA
jgi:hypothetical protein